MMMFHAMPSTVGKICNSKNKILGGRKNDAGLFLYHFHKYMNKFSNAVM
jgi:hypothetical protein